jgi:HEAT repeat protein
MKRLLAIVAVCLVALAVSRPALGREVYFLAKSLDRWRSELRDPQAKVRRSAAFALGRFGYSARSSVPELRKLMRQDDSAEVRDMAAAAIGDIAKAIGEGDRSLWGSVGGDLINVLKTDKDPHVRRSAAYALGAFGAQAAEAMETLRAALRDKDASVRQNAAWALGQIGEEAGGAVEALCGCLSDSDVLVRRDAAGALGSMGKAGGEGVGRLIDMVKTETDEVVKKTVLDSLSQLAGPKNKDVARGLDQLLKDKDREIALSAALILARIGGEESTGALPVLRTALKDPDAHVQELASAALVNLGPNAEPAMYDLADTLTKSTNPSVVRRNAALAISHIGAPAKPVVPALAEALKPSEPLQVRQYAAEALAQLRFPANEKALSAILTTIQRDTDPLVRQRCVFALLAMEDLKEGGADKVLTKVLDETSVDHALVRYDAARKLADALQEKAPDKTADVLLEMLKNKSLIIYNRTDAKLEGTDNEANRGKVNVAANTGGDARYMAAVALGQLGEKAKKRPDVVAALKEAAKDKDPALKRAAVTALKELGVQ